MRMAYVIIEGVRRLRLLAVVQIAAVTLNPSWSSTGVGYGVGTDIHDSARRDLFRLARLGTLAILLQGFDLRHGWKSWSCGRCLVAAISASRATFN